MATARDSRSRARQCLLARATWPRRTPSPTISGSIVVQKPSSPSDTNVAARCWASSVSNANGSSTLNLPWPGWYIAADYQAGTSDPAAHRGPPDQKGCVGCLVHIGLGGQRLQLGDADVAALLGGCHAVGV